MCDFREKGEICHNPLYIGSYNKTSIIEAAKSLSETGGIVNFMQNKLKSILRPGTYSFTRCEKHCMFKNDAIGTNDNGDIIMMSGNNILNYQNLPYCKLETIRDNFGKCSKEFNTKYKVDKRKYYNNIYPSLDLMERDYTRQENEHRSFIRDIDTCIIARQDYKDAYIDESDPRFYYLPPLDVVKYFSHGSNFIIKSLIELKTKCQNNLTDKIASYGYIDAIESLRMKYLLNDKNDSKLNSCLNPLFGLKTEPSLRKKCNEINKYKTILECDYNDYFSNDFYAFNKDDEWNDIKKFYMNTNCDEEIIQSTQKAQQKIMNQTRVSRTTATPKKSKKKSVRVQPQLQRKIQQKTLQQALKLREKEQQIIRQRQQAERKELQEKERKIQTQSKRSIIKQNIQQEILRQQNKSIQSMPPEKIKNLLTVIMDDFKKFNVTTDELFKYMKLKPKMDPGDQLENIVLDIFFSDLDSSDITKMSMFIISNTENNINDIGLFIASFLIYYYKNNQQYMNPIAMILVENEIKLMGLRVNKKVLQRLVFTYLILLLFSIDNNIRRKYIREYISIDNLKYHLNIYCNIICKYLNIYI
jgi:hypothetical protein